jgi:hypothetical protein
MSLVGTTFTTGLAIYLIYGGNRPNPSNIGFLLNTASESSMISIRERTDVFQPCLVNIYCGPYKFGMD